MGRGSLIKRWKACICSLLEQHGLPRTACTVEWVCAHHPRFAHLRFYVDEGYWRTHFSSVGQVLDAIANDPVVQRLYLLEGLNSVSVFTDRPVVIFLYMDNISEHNITPEACGWDG